jgi:hypothetical protein
LSEPPVEERPEVAEPVAPGLEKADYESLMTGIVTLEPAAKKINSARILETLGKLKAQVEEELKDLVFQDYLKSKVST